MNNDAESQDDMMGLMDEDELDPEMRDTLRARLAKKTRKSYEDTLTRFFRFLFDNLDDHQGIFQENFLLRLGVAAAEDSERRTARGQLCKSRPSFNAEARHTIKNIRPEDPETHPICFEKLSFVVFARWLKTFRKPVKCFGRIWLITLMLRVGIYHK